ncbi:lipopolysaccharide biosynthesis protein [Aeromonas allosaccharophila]
MNVDRKAKKAVMWAYAGTFAKICIQFVSQIILARQLGPGEYGVFAVGLTVVSLSVLFADSGAGAALIQKKQLENTDIAFSLTVQLILGSLITAAIMLCAPAIADFYGEPRTISVIRWLAIVVLFTAVGSVSNCLLKRNLDFKTIQLAQVTGFFCGYVLVGIPLSLSGYGVWSLVAAWVIQSVVNISICYYRVRHPLSLTLVGGGGVLNFGLTTMLSNLASWFSSNVDKVVVGRFFSTAELAVYTIPFTFLGTLCSQFITTLQPVFFSSASRLQEEKDTLQANLLFIIEVVCLLIIPILATIATIPDVVIQVIYGRNWLPAADIMQAASIGFIFFSISGLLTPVLWGVGRVKNELFPQIATAITLLTIAVVLAQYSMLAISWGVSFLFSLRLIWIIISTANALKCSVYILIKPLLPGVLSAVVCSLSASYSHRFQLFNTHSLIWEFIFHIIMSVLILISCVIFMKNRILSKALSAKITY